MNIMLVSVTERTREIRIRKSLRRRKNHYAAVCDGGCCHELHWRASGIGLGCTLTGWIGKLMGMEAVTPAPILVSFGVSMGIGLLFGYMPASRAARLNPIDALRSD